MVSIYSLPSEILIDNIIPLLSVQELLTFASTCKAFYSFAFDEVYWRKLVTSTFRLPAQPLRENGWRDLYKNLHKATLFTWGSNDKGRLGHDDHILRVPFPLDVDLQPNQVAVDVVMGGWSTTVLTNSGSLYIWGTLGGLWRGDRHIHRSLKLQFPPAYETSKIAQVSSGRSHVLGLSNDGHIWQWTQETQPGQFVKFANIDTKTTHLGARRAPGTVEKVTAGWNHSAALVNGVGIVVWFPSRVSVNEGLIDGEIVPGTCYTDNSPKPSTILEDDWEFAKEVGEVIGIMAGESYLLFLTKYGKVYAIRAQPDNVAGIRPTQLLTFSAPEGENPMTYISGNFRKFAVFNNSGLVYIGTQDIVNQALNSTTSTGLGVEDEEPQMPIIIPSLQNRNIVAIAFGDYHSLSLTSEGKVLVWGTEPSRCGCLGLGPPEVARRKGVVDGVLEESTEVRFDWFETNPIYHPQSLDNRKDGTYFVFNIAAAGWHSGALVLVPDKKWGEDTKAHRVSAIQKNRAITQFRNRPRMLPHHIFGPQFQGLGRPVGEAGHGGISRPSGDTAQTRPVGDITASNPIPFISHGPPSVVLPHPTPEAGSALQIGEGCARCNGGGLQRSLNQEVQQQGSSAGEEE